MNETTDVTAHIGTPAGREEVIDELIYRSYRFNRNLAPDVEAGKWQLIYGSISPAMEARYQREMAERN